MITLTISTHERNTLEDLTDLLNQQIRTAGWKTGVLYVFNTHTTAGLTINEGADPAVRRDILTVLGRLIPARGDYQHSEGNSDAHTKAALVGNHVVVPVENGKMVLGTWQTVYFCEFDGPRRRTVQLMFVPATNG